MNYVWFEHDSDLFATNRKVSSSAIPNSIAKMESPGSLDIPRYFYFYLTPSELEAMSV